MTFNELYKKLEDSTFNDTTTGSLFYNVYICQYNVEDEYEVVKTLKGWEESLIRPANYIDVLLIDIFDEYCSFLDGKSFGKHESMFNYLINKEKEDSQAVQETLIRNAGSDDFIAHIDKKIKAHLKKENDKKQPFIFFYGFGRIYPYLRVNAFLSNFERYNSGENIKILIFYPGKVSGNSFSLFGLLNDNHTYRSIKLFEEPLTIGD
ncbi:MAG TPA: DUF1788 domain-containing protein [Bacteroidales bacterium]|jgi:hypothetical protein|nr:DUF1788 domain-containing protein [Bacteroidales bacterium]